MIFALDPDTGQPILEGGDLVRLTDPLEILAQRMRFRLRTIAGEVLTRTDLGMPLESLLEKGLTPVEVANVVREVLRTIDGIESIDEVTPADEPTPAGRLPITIVVTALEGGQLTLVEDF